MLARTAIWMEPSGISDAARAAIQTTCVHCEELVAVKSASGKNGRCSRRRWESRNSRSAICFAKNSAEPDLTQLANDPIRVLNLAAQYMRLGLYQKAVDGVSAGIIRSPVA